MSLSQAAKINFNHKLASESVVRIFWLLQVHLIVFIVMVSQIQLLISLSNSSVEVRLLKAFVAFVL